MTNPLPRISSAYRIGPAVLGVTWSDGPSDRVNLAEWIASGGEVLAPLKDPDVFATARPGEQGGSVEWANVDGNLAIDAHHLRRLADEQRLQR